MKERDPRFIPINPVFFASSSELELNVEFMHPKIKSEISGDPMLKVSEARFPSDEEKSA